MDIRAIRRNVIAAIGVTGVGLALGALFLLSRTPQKDADFESLHIIILLINIAGVVVLFALTVGNLARLLRDYRNHVPGRRLRPPPVL